MITHHELDRELEAAMDKLGADSGTIHLKDGAAPLLHLAAHRNLPDQLIEAIEEIPWGKGMAGVAAEKGEPVDYCNLQTTTAPEVHPQARNTGTHGAIVVPMMYGEEVVGTIGIGCNRERAFTDSEVAWLMELGRRLGGEYGEQRIAA